MIQTVTQEGPGETVDFHWYTLYYKLMIESNTNTEKTKNFHFEIDLNWRMIVNNSRSSLQHLCPLSSGVTVHVECFELPSPLEGGGRGGWWSHTAVSVSSMIVYKKGTQPFGRQTTCTVALCNRTLTVSYCVCVVTCNFLVKKKKIYQQHFSKWTFDPRRPWKILIFPQTSTHSKVRSQPIESPPAGPLPQMAVSISYIQSVAGPGRVPWASAHLFYLAFVSGTVQEALGSSGGGARGRRDLLPARRHRDRGRNQTQRNEKRKCDWIFCGGRDTAALNY